MRPTTLAGVASVLAMMALAGCTGSFDIDQTEPIRVQLDGAPQTVVVREGAEPREVKVQTCADATATCDVEDVEVQVKVEKTSTKPCTLLVTIKDEAGNVLDQVTINVGTGSGSASPTTTSGNETNGTTTVTETQTTTETATVTEGSSSNVVIQNLVVNVKGHKNIIVVTQAQQGEANVDIQAIQASGHADVDNTGDTGVSSTASASASMTTTSSSSNSTGPY